MILDANKLEASNFAERSYDVCVAGAGVAGIVLARKLAVAGLKVALLEAGGTDFSEESQAFYKGDVIGHDYFDLDTTRLRFLGGTSNHWGGWCRTLDAIDFQKKDYVEWSGWPIERRNLEPYFEEAASILDVDPVFDDIRTVDTLRQVRFHFSRPPTNMRDKYFTELDTSERVDTYLNLALTDIVLNESGNTVEHFTCHRGDLSNRNPVDVFADWYVLTLGGLETPRLLLNCDHQNPNGLGNSNDLVGRFFMDHPTYTLGYLALRDPSDPVFERFSSLKERLRSLLCRTDLTTSMTRYVRPNFKCTTSDFWAPTPAFMRERKILNCGLRVNVDRDAGSDPFVGALGAAFEQEPNPDSRVVLLDDRDAYGLRRIALDWRLTALDKRTPRECALEFGKKMIEFETGRLKLVDWLLDEDADFPGVDEDEVAGNHHMGTTRMADSPDRGVVDPDCLLFGTTNLFLAGSNVFPSGGYANPTLTIVQITLRLADYITQLSRMRSVKGRG